MRMLHHLSRMLGRRFALLAALIVSSLSVSYAQGQYALLTHDGATQVFSGTNALVDANEAAVDGDIITLSAGSFNNNLDITKSITLRGAGMGMADVGTNLREVTISPKAEGGEVIIEGINASYLKINANYDLTSFSILVSKCKVESYDHREGARWATTIRDSFIMGGSVRYSIIENSVFVDIFPQESNCYNSVILKSDGTNASENNYVNCVVYVNDQSIFYPSATNTVFIHGLDSSSDKYTAFHESMSQKSPSSKLFPVGTTVFKEGSLIYELTDDNASAWLGNDGKQVGIHGGAKAFSPTPSNPQFTTFKVAEKTSSNGMLQVEIAIE